eukprot:1160720-Pelagomonas_calceolata.AAC.12
MLAHSCAHTRGLGKVLVGGQQVCVARKWLGRRAGGRPAIGLGCGSLGQIRAGQHRLILFEKASNWAGLGAIRAGPYRSAHEWAGLREFRGDESGSSLLLMSGNFGAWYNGD